MQLKVKVVPGASSDQIVGWLGDALKIRVAAPPEKGKANSAVVRMLAQALELPAAAISVCSGQTSKMKTIQIAGITHNQLREKLSRIPK